MSQDYDQHIILHHLDDPLRIFYWTVDEAVALGGPLFGGIFMGHPFLGLIASALCFKGLRTIKKTYGLENLRHALYWYLPKNKKKLPHVPDSYKREYIG